MATWKSDKTVKFTEDLGEDYSKSEMSWEYSTTTDCLTICTKRSKNFSDLPLINNCYFGKNNSLAMLEILIDWADCYEGPEIVDKIFSKARK